MARVCITDLFVPDDLSAPLLHGLAAIVDEENADTQFSPVDFAPPRDPVEQAVGEAEFIANQSGPAPTPVQIAAIVGEFVEKLFKLMK